MSKSKRVTTLILGILIIIFYGYRFFLIKRLPYEINDKISWRIFLIVIIAMLVQLIIAVTLLQELRKRTIQRPAWIIKVLEIIYYKPLQLIRESLLKLTVIKNLAADWSNIINFSIHSSTSLYSITIALFIIPRILLVTCLIADVFLFQKIYCFYQLLWVILIPISLQIMLAFAKQYSNTSCESLELVAEKTAKEYTFKLTTAQQITINEFQTRTTLWTYYTTILQKIEDISQCQKSTSYLLLSLLSTVLFFISWLGYIMYVLQDSLFVFTTNPLIINFITVIIRSLLGI